MGERRRLPSPTDPEEYLHQLPAFELLSRLPTAVLGVGLLGEIAYANPAFADMLGYLDGRTVTRLYLPDLLTGHEAYAPVDCLNTLRTGDSAVEWNHSQGYVIRTMVSPPLLLRETDTLLLIGATDVTDWLWENDRRATARPRSPQPAS